jgi:hypothetical protein
MLHRLFSGDNRPDDVPMATLTSGRRDSMAPHQFNDEDDDAEHHL